MQGQGTTWKNVKKWPGISLLTANRVVKPVFLRRCSFVGRSRHWHVLADFLMCSILCPPAEESMKTRSSWDFHRDLSVMCFVIRFLVRCAAKWDPKDFTTKPPLPSQMMLMWIWDSLKNGPWISIGLKFNVSILNRLLFRIRVFSHSWEFPRLNQCSTQTNNALSHASLAQTPKQNCPGKSHWSLEVDGVEVETLWEEIRAILGIFSAARIEV